jgi:hypothetical protein
VLLFLADHPPDGGVREALLRCLFHRARREMATTDLDASRLSAAKNQSLFRDVNERIEKLSEKLEARAMIRFVCECALKDCVERLEMSHGEYEVLRRVPTHFAVKHGHEIEGVEETVDYTGRYVVVEKLGVGGVRARKLDPRRPDGDPSDT